VKKLLFLLLAIILLASCNTEVCPAYSDSANNVRSTLFQSGSYRADGINKVYRDAYSYRKK
jgi:type III secretory pathway lipoprotein EscJ